MRRVRTIAGCHAALAMAFLAACDPPSRATSDAPASITGSGAPSTAPTRAPDRRIPELDVPRVEDDEVQIDGALDEAAWKRAAIAGPFVDVSTGAPLDERALTARAPVQGSARLLWSEGFLYVAFDIYDTDVRGGFDADA